MRKSITESGNFIRPRRPPIGGLNHPIIGPVIGGLLKIGRESVLLAAFQPPRGLPAAAGLSREIAPPTRRAIYRQGKGFSLSRS